MCGKRVCVTQQYFRHEACSNAHLVPYFRIQEFKVTLSEENINLKTLRELCFNGNAHTV